jgi:hypothetical protein
MVKYFCANWINSFSCSDIFVGGWWKLHFCLVLTWQTSEFTFNVFSLLTSNKTSDSTYCDYRGTIFRFLIKSLSESLLLHPVITLITFSFLHFKNLCTMWRIPPKYWSTVHNGMEIGTEKHFQCFVWHKKHNWSYWVASCT